MPQFRALGVVRRHPGASLSVVAGHIGLTTASVSKLIDSLVKKGLVTRADSPDDRRKVVLNATKTVSAPLRSRGQPRWDAWLGCLPRWMSRIVPRSSGRWTFSGER